MSSLIHSGAFVEPDEPARDQALAPPINFISFHAKGVSDLHCGRKPCRTLVLPRAAATVCHCMLPGTSEPPRFSALM